MADTAITSRISRFGEVEEILRHCSPAALTTGTYKWEWVIPCYGRIADIICNAETIGVDGTSTLIDVNKNGTTLYTTQANRPTLLLANTGLFSEAGVGPDAALTVVPGDIISYDVDQITTTTGPARFTITILIIGR